MDAVPVLGDSNTAASQPVSAELLDEFEYPTICEGCVAISPDVKEAMASGETQRRPTSFALAVVKEGEV